MTIPVLSDFSELLSRHATVPVYKKIIADLDTPLTLFNKVAAFDKHAFLFESMEGGEKWGRYSFIGFDPLCCFSSKGDEIVIEEKGENASAETITAADPIEELKKLLSSFEVADYLGLPKFYGGAVGFLGYDMVRFIERLPDRHSPLSVPDSSFMIPGVVLIHDSQEQTVTIVCNLRRDGSDNSSAEDIYQRGKDKIEKLAEIIRNPLQTVKPVVGCKRHDFKSNMGRDDFLKMVEKARDYILAGDIIQVVLSQRFSSESELDPMVLYRALRHVNPSPYLFYLRLDDNILIGSSPEILVRLEDGAIELRPIAGTRKRGRDKDEDEALAEELLADPKERAEHFMLVDLGRNDVGRVAAPGSVEVRDMLSIEKYSHVMHIVSGVHGRLSADKDQFDLFRACFPAGTLSGAAKVRAMEIIDELEVSRRGVYGGAVGYFGFSGNMDFCITIRTFLLEKEQETGKWQLHIQAGAGVVADSDPEKEYEETVNKSMGLRRAVQLAEQGLQVDKREGER